MPPHSSDTSASSRAQPRSLCVDTHRHPTTTPTSPSGVSPPPFSTWGAADPHPVSPQAARGTFGLGVVHCKHVDGHELEHAGASDGRGAVLQQHLELPQDLLGHRRESLHPADREREAGESRLCPGMWGGKWAWHSPRHISWRRGNPWGAVSHPGAVGNEGAGCFLREGQ